MKSVAQTRVRNCSSVTCSLRTPGHVDAHRDFVLDGERQERWGVDLKIGQGGRNCPGDASLAAEAERLLADESPLVRGAAIWALGRLDRDRLRRVEKRRTREADPDLNAEWAAALGESQH